MTEPDPIAEYYARKDAELAREREEHLAAGKPIATFNPRTFID